MKLRYILIAAGFAALFFAKCDVDAQNTAWIAEMLLGTATTILGFWLGYKADEYEGKENW